MVIDETRKIISEVKAFRPYFSTGNSQKEDIAFARTWQRVFEPYAYDDVSEKLNSWFKSSDHFGKTPDAYELIKGLLTIKDKQNLENKSMIIISCHLCGNKYSLDKFDEHFGRCLSIDYIVRVRKKYLDKETSQEQIQKLKSMSEEKFNEVYLNYIENLKDVITNQNELNAINHLLEKENNSE